MNRAPAHDWARLPRLGCGPSGWRLPLSDCAALELAQVLVLDTRGVQLRRLRQLLAEDPPLALWTVCRAGRESAWQPRSLEDVATWLADHVSQALQWTSLDAVSPDRVRRAVPVRWRELAADSVAVAHLAAHQASDAPQAAEAYLLGMLHNTVAWLHSCGPRISPRKSDAGCLPGWLAGLLREKSRSAGLESVPAVARGIALWRAAGRRGRRVGPVDLGVVSRVRRRWQLRSPGDDAATWFLPRLTDSLRRLADLEERFHQTLETEKLAAMGELAYGASHEINNPLANVSTRAQAMLAQESDPEKRRMLATICAQAFRAHEMIADLMLFARPPALEYQTLDLVRLVEDVISELHDDARAQGSHVVREGEEAEVLADVDATQLGMAVRAVCVNALEALVAEGEVTVRVDRIAAPDPTADAWARITICDTAPGIPPAVRRHLFDPFFSGREAGRGLGMGLAKCWRAVTLHGGRIEVADRKPRGTVFRIELPLRRAHAASESAQAVPASALER
ncbi:MAG: HAMP domain-containing histidine kinase [Pirellulaceae bacterium]|nr:HAMP domain-containing histidine kinase [Pirellulaceae bacterium]